ncbi:MAG: dTDP-4-dehydrorhamnose 3,5-epimerase [Gemmatimonadaceae bacterium]
MQVTPCALPEVLLITPRVFSDDRGFFLESYNQREFERAGIRSRFVQDNHSRSDRGVLRGLHYQLGHPQSKLVRAVRGAIFDVAVDIRVGSPSFSKWVGVVLDDVRKQSLFIPEGFAHGFCVLSDQADVAYKATDFYAPDAEKGIVWNDPSLAIAWPIDKPVVSPKDLAFGLLVPTSPELPKYPTRP